MPTEINLQKREIIELLERFFTFKKNLYYHEVTLNLPLTEIYLQKKERESLERFYVLKKPSSRLIQGIPIGSWNYKKKMKESLKQFLYK